MSYYSELCIFSTVVYEKSWRFPDKLIRIRKMCFYKAAAWFNYSSEKKIMKVIVSLVKKMNNFYLFLYRCLVYIIQFLYFKTIQKKCITNPFCQSSAYQNV